MEKEIIIKREYCNFCGDILLKEKSIYFPDIILTICYKCKFLLKIEKYDEQKKALDICKKYWLAVHGEKPVTSAEKKTGQRRPKKNMIDID